MKYAKHRKDPNAIIQPDPMPEVALVSEEEALAQKILWQRGNLKWLLWEPQKLVYDKIWEVIKDPSPDMSSYVLNCSRRFGKTFTMCLVAVEFAIRNPGCNVRLVAPSGRQLADACWGSIRLIFLTCPKDMMPHLIPRVGEIKFKNGSMIKMSGADKGHIENMRGQDSNLNLIDEAAFFDDLDYAYKSVLSPLTVRTHGKTIISSTPPRTPDHDYVDYYRAHKERGLMSEFTIYDDPTITERQLQRAILDSGGIDTTTFKREYLCSFITDDELALVPKWDQSFEYIPEKNDKYDYYHKYVSLDLGTTDFTVALYGYYDYENARLVIEDEFSIKGPQMTTDVLAEELKFMEFKLWGPKPPYLRISDNSLGLMLQDLGLLHGIHFTVTNKDSLEAMVNKVKVWVNQGRIIVNPKCTQLIGCLKYGIWSSKHSGLRQFARSKVYGHYDAFAALVYLIRNITDSVNPVPRSHGIPEGSYQSMKQKDLSTTDMVVQKIFRRRF